MGIAWGAEIVDQSYLRSFPDYVAAWREICAKGLCPRFAVGVGETLHVHERTTDGSAAVIVLPAPEIIRGVRALRCDDTSWGAIDALDGCSLFFPDELGPRAIALTTRFFRHRKANDLRALRNLRGGGFAAQARALAELCEPHGLMVAFDV